MEWTSVCSSQDNSQTNTCIASDKQNWTTAGFARFSIEHCRLLAGDVDSTCHCQIIAHRRMALQSTKQMYSYLLLLACVNLALSQAPGERQDTVRKTLHAIHSNPCQKEEGNKTRYYACSSEPLHLLRPQNANFNFSTTPLSATCGVAPTTYCTLVSQKHL